MGKGAAGESEHKFCGDAIVTLIAEVRRLRELHAHTMNLPVGAVALSPAAAALVDNTGTTAHEPRDRPAPVAESFACHPSNETCESWGGPKCTPTIESPGGTP